MLKNSVLIMDGILCTSWLCIAPLELLSLAERPPVLLTSGARPAILLDFTYGDVASVLAYLIILVARFSAAGGDIVSFGSSRDCCFGEIISIDLFDSDVVPFDVLATDFCFLFSFSALSNWYNLLSSTAFSSLILLETNNRSLNCLSL